MAHAFQLTLLLATVVGSTAEFVDKFFSSTQAPQRRLMKESEDFSPVPWLSLEGANYYIVLPEIDNWSMFGDLKTTWTKIRIQSFPQVGHTSVILDLHDFTHSESNGKIISSGFMNVSSVEWGVAGDCETYSNESEMRINLTGTPFRYDPVYPLAVGAYPHGQVVCAPGNQYCFALCGGSCGSCGLGMAGLAHHALLRVVDQPAFDYAMGALAEAASAAYAKGFMELMQNTTAPPSPPSVTAAEDAGSARMTLWIEILLVLAVAFAVGCCICGIAWAVRRRRAENISLTDCMDPPPQTFGDSPTNRSAPKIAVGESSACAASESHSPSKADA
jgi:hypothetical protein